MKCLDAGLAPQVGRRSVAFLAVLGRRVARTVWDGGVITPPSDNVHPQPWMDRFSSQRILGNLVVEVQFKRNGAVNQDDPPAALSAVDRHYQSRIFPNRKIFHFTQHAKTRSHLRERNFSTVNHKGEAYCRRKRNLFDHIHGERQRYSEETTRVRQAA